MRARCTNLDPRRADRLRHPTARLYAEYIWGYVAAIQRAPLSRPTGANAIATWRGGWPAGSSRWLAAFRGGLQVGDVRCPRAADSLGRRHRGRPGEEALVTLRGAPAGARGPPAAPRVGLFGLLGSAISVTTPRWSPCSRISRADHPDAIVDAMCTGPERVTDAVRHRGHPLYWYQKHEQQASGVTAIALKVLGKGVDTFRTASWVRRHDVVIVPGTGVLEATPSAAGLGISVRDVLALRVRESSSGRRSRWSAWGQTSSTSG